MSEPRFTINPNIDGLFASLVKPAAEASARILVDAIKDTLEEAPPRTGLEYYVPGTKTKYTASAPGEVPAIREGHYRDSWKATKAYETPDGIGASAVSDLATDDGQPIGLILEDGTSDIINYRVRMQPRPHLRESINRALPLIDAKLAELRKASS